MSQWNRPIDCKILLTICFKDSYLGQYFSLKWIWHLPQNKWEKSLRWGSNSKSTNLLYRSCHHILNTLMAFILTMLWLRNPWVSTNNYVSPQYSVSIYRHYWLFFILFLSHGHVTREISLAQVNTIWATRLEPVNPTLNSVLNNVDLTTTASLIL